MKTLDEVIAELEDSLPKTCADALHYLKELRDITDISMEYFENGGTSQKFCNTLQITCPKCHSEFLILPEANNALTWDELRLMEGKPVWVEKCQDDEPKGWLLILRTNADVVNCTTKHGNSFYLCRSLYGEKWQAYRKEHK